MVVNGINGVNSRKTTVHGSEFQIKPISSFYKAGVTIPTTQGLEESLVTKTLVTSAAIIINVITTSAYITPR